MVNNQNVCLNKQNLLECSSNRSECVRFDKKGDGNDEWTLQIGNRFLVINNNGYLELANDTSSFELFEIKFLSFERNVLVSLKSSSNQRYIGVGLESSYLNSRAVEINETEIFRLVKLPLFDFTN